MRKICLTLAFVLALATLVNAETVIRKKGFVKGNYFLSFTDPQKSLYVMGLYDGMAMSPLIYGNPQKQEAFFKCYKYKTNTQLAQILTSYLNENPEARKQYAAVSFYQATIENCPELMDE